MPPLTLAADDLVPDPDVPQPGTLSHSRPSQIVCASYRYSVRLPIGLPVQTFHYYAWIPQSSPEHAQPHDESRVGKDDHDGLSTRVSETCSHRRRRRPEPLTLESQIDGRKEDGDGKGCQEGYRIISRCRKTTREEETVVASVVRGTIAEVDAILCWSFGVLRSPHRFALDVVDLVVAAGCSVSGEW